MHILIAPDKFKDSLTAAEVCDAIREGILLYNSNFDVITIPMADGGNGTAEILTSNTGGAMHTVPVHDPLMRKIKASYGISGDGKTAFMEMAAASGLELLKDEERNCMITSTFGTGELLLDAINHGVDSIIMGIGGSATTDGGMGMAAALGFQFTGEDGKVLDPVGENLIKVREIKKPADFSSLSGKIRIRVACDVENPLYGKNGAAFIYGPQKGAGEKEVKILDEGLKNFAVHLKRFSGRDVSHIPGSGAAGGLGAGLMALLNGELVPGVKLVMEETGFEKHLEGIDLVITGEGKMDIQTLQGKVVHGVCKIARLHNIPVAALAGSMLLSPEQLQSLPVCYAASITTGPMELTQALKNARELIRNAAWNLVGLFCAGRE